MPCAAAAAAEGEARNAESGEERDATHGREEGGRERREERRAAAAARRERDEKHADTRRVQRKPERESERGERTVRISKQCTVSPLYRGGGGHLGSEYRARVGAE